MQIKEMKLYSDSNGKIKGSVVSSAIEVESWNEYVNTLKQNMDEFDVKNYGIFSMKLTDDSVRSAIRLRNGEFVEMYSLR